MPGDKVQFGLGLLYLAIAGMNFVDRNSRYGWAMHRYMWIVWLFGAVCWFYRAFRPKRASKN